MAARKKSTGTRGSARKGGGRKTGAKKSAGKKSSARKTGGRKSSAGKSGKRELISPRGDNRYVRRTSSGKFSESDDQGRSLKQDVKKKARRKVKSGQGDRGDQKR